MRVLVSAASRYGSTLEIARAIADVLRRNGLDASAVPVDDVDDVEAFDAVVLGSGVYAGHWLKPATTLVDRFGDALAARPVWLFSSGPVGDPPKPAEDSVDVSKLLTATRARDHRVFTGRIERRKLRFADRAIAAALHVPDGDFRSWPDIEGWAAEIADALSELAIADA
jgi:menaquinone-dependent protoporphyrinogen oxidase